MVVWFYQGAHRRLWTRKKLTMDAHEIARAHRAIICLYEGKFQMKGLKHPNVLLIILDCCRPDRMSCYGYHKNTTPNINMILNESTIFENAISVAPWSLPSHASMFTGLYPSEHGATTWDSKMRPDVKTLAEILSESGYETAAVCQNDGWINRSTGLSKGFKTFYGYNEIFIPTILRSSRKYLSALKHLLAFYYNFILREDITSLSISLCQRILKKNKNNPIFLFVNLLNAHYPYLPSTRSFKTFFLETMEEFRNSVKGAEKTWITRKWKQLATKKEFTKDEFKTMNNLYDNCIFYLDHHLGELFKFMKKEEIMDKTLLIITSDHGENIGDHKLIDHELSVHDSLIKVPLIIRYPNIFPRNKSVIRQVETRNLFHTILDATSVSQGSKIKDNSLVRAIELSSVENYAFGEYSPSPKLVSRISMYSPITDSKYISSRKFVRTKDFKYVKYESDDEELRDLRDEEKKVSPKKHPQIFEQLKNRIEMWEHSLIEERKSGEKEEKKIIERLKALGYF